MPESKGNKNLTLSLWRIPVLNAPPVLRDLLNRYPCLQGRTCLEGGERGLRTQGKRASLRACLRVTELPQAVVIHSDPRALQELQRGCRKSDTILLLLPSQLSFKKRSPHSQGQMKARQPAKQIHLFPYWKAVETVRAPASWIKSLKFFKKKPYGRNKRKETPRRKAGLPPTGARRRWGRTVAGGS